MSDIAIRLDGILLALFLSVGAGIFALITCLALLGALFATAKVQR